MNKPVQSKEDLVLEWATPFFIVTFTEIDELNQELAAVIIRKEKEFATRSNPIKHTPQYWSHFSSFHYQQDLFSWRGKAIATLKDMIAEAAERFAHRHFGNAPFKITRLAGWANVNRIGDWHGPHNHFSGDQCLSGVYWVSNSRIPSDMFDLDGSLVYLDPRGYGCPARHDVVLGPQPGQMVIQPSWLAHIVTPKRSKGLRISIAFDIFVERNPWWDSKAHIVRNLDSR